MAVKETSIKNGGDRWRGRSYRAPNHHLPPHGCSFLISRVMPRVRSAGGRQMKFSRVVSGAGGVVAGQSLQTLRDGTVRLKGGGL